MRKYIFAAAFLLLFVAADRAEAGAMRVYEYYYDAAFTQYAGDSYTNCSLICVYNCTRLADYRVVEQENCTTGTITRWCEHWTGSSWQTISCP